MAAACCSLVHVCQPLAGIGCMVLHSKQRTAVDLMFFHRALPLVMYSALSVKPAFRLIHACGHRHIAVCCMMLHDVSQQLQFFALLTEAEWC